MTAEEADFVAETLTAAGYSVTLLEPEPGMEPVADFAACGYRGGETWSFVNLQTLEDVAALTAMMQALAAKSCT